MYALDYLVGYKSNGSWIIKTTITKYSSYFSMAIRNTHTHTKSCNAYYWDKYCHITAYLAYLFFCFLVAFYSQL